FNCPLKECQGLCHFRFGVEILYSKYLYRPRTSVFFHEKTKPDTACYFLKYVIVLIVFVRMDTTIYATTRFYK
ncbi:MAG: hypothetical protein ACK5IQ_03530, partial [Bacteroidales bacterium]